MTLSIGKIYIDKERNDYVFCLYIQVFGIVGSGDDKVLIMGVINRFQELDNVVLRCGLRFILEKYVK